MLRLILRWIRKTYALLAALAAFMGMPGQSAPVPVAPPTATPSPLPAPVAPVPAPSARKVIGQCATGTSGPKQWFATCIVDRQQTGLPGSYPTRAAAQQAIRDYRAANA